LPVTGERFLGHAPPPVPDKSKKKPPTRTSISFIDTTEHVYECFFKINSALIGPGDEGVAGWLGGRRQRTDRARGPPDASPDFLKGTN
jgi:hypothetical protein